MYGQQARYSTVILVQWHHKRDRVRRKGSRGWTRASGRRYCSRNDEREKRVAENCRGRCIFSYKILRTPRRHSLNNGLRIWLIKQTNISLIRWGCNGMDSRGKNNAPCCRIVLSWLFVYFNGRNRWDAWRGFIADCGTSWNIVHTREFWKFGKIRKITAWEGNFLRERSNFQVCFMEMRSGKCELENWARGTVIRYGHVCPLPE